MPGRTPVMEIPRACATIIGPGMSFFTGGDAM